MTRIFFTTDVHGSDMCFRKFLNAAKVYKASCLILGGDITGKVLIPIIEREDGKYEAQVFGERAVFGREKVAETRKRLQDAGQYSFVTTKAGLAEIQADKSREEAVFNGAMAEVLRSWVDLVQVRLRGTETKCYVSPGNDDKLEIDSDLVDAGPFINPEEKVVEIDGGFEMITLGTANPTPWKSPREVSEERLREMIERLVAQVNRPEDAIYNLHVPPVNTELDRAPAVSHDFTYVREGLGVKYIHAGSSAVRGAIEAHSPLLGLHGHIHESKGFVRIGRTLCLNPGSEYADGILRGALVNLQPGRVHDFLLTSG
ncbi:MAG: metallophosphoesterase [Nitrososphaerota archaeon]|nr:metallophosphoesterase [Nitrososphaerota archaeon]MDG6916467.1 metallophosphoesterase [Nitrososphaerota archaeon]MDG6918818.1 metallophosphoesterase [Nitrososphaerota archaeon]MDG6946566.1 metallophosphoesterase [Nitrososphaerota archaeon]MDG6947723.1 metallophosphoesterase [Nitrososphaerota archaeon]